MGETWGLEHLSVETRNELWALTEMNYTDELWVQLYSMTVSPVEIRVHTFFMTSIVLSNVWIARPEDYAAF